MAPSSRGFSLRRPRSAAHAPAFVPGLALTARPVLASGAGRVAPFACKALLALALLAVSLAARAGDPSDFETPEYFAQGGLRQINAAEAYAWGYTGSGVTVGVVDSGLAAAHPEFQGRFGGGYDFFVKRFMDGTTSYDGFGHGSHVSGIVAANRDGVGMHGVAFDARIFGLRMPPTADADVSMGPSWALMATLNLPIVNNSLSVDKCSPSSPPPCNITDYDQAKALATLPTAMEGLRSLAASGPLMVFAAGNSSQPNPDLLGGMPFLFSEFESQWLTVVAVGPDNRITDYSNRCGVASGWCLAAPGGGDDTDRDGIYSVRNTGGYVRDSGTSMAAPQVAGTAALVKQAYPFFTAHNLQQTLLTTATPLGDPAVYGWGLLNAGKAVRGPARFVDVFDVDTQGYFATFHNDIDGAGSLVKRGAGQLTLVGANTYTGPTEVQEGKLVVDGSLASTVRVAAAGALGGSGRVGGLDNAGTVAPGNSVGTLRVDGDYVSRPGSVYAVEADAGGNDRIQVSGTATLEGGIVEIRSGQPFLVGSRYSILSADGGIVGRYDQARTAQGLVFLAPALDYALPGTLQVAIERSGVAFDRYLSTSNQRAVGRALDAASAAPPAGLADLYTPILNGSAESLAAGMDQLSGEAHASTRSALLEAGGALRRAVSRRLRDSRGLASPMGAPIAGAAGAMPSGATSAASGPPLWIEVVGGRDTIDGDGNAARVASDAAGLFLGGDVAIANGLRVGVALGHADGRVRVDERASRANVESATGAVYGGRGWDLGVAGRVDWLAGAAYTRHAVDSRRELSVGGLQTLRADHAVHAVQLFTELSHAVPMGTASVLEPYAGLAWMHQRSGGFTESGGAAALHSDGDTDRVTMLTLGLRGRTAWSLSGKDVALSAGLGWRHAEGDLRPASRLSFAQAGEVAFTVSGAPIARDAALVELDAQVAHGRRAAFGLSYGGQFGRGATAHEGSVFFRWRF